jgi:ABC-type branched-subunit amino acid transport system ATPase component
VTPILELNDVRAWYNGALVLDGVSLSVGQGETVGLLGRNGAGKTTTLLSIFGVPTTVTGGVVVDGVQLGKRRYEPASRGVALAPQGKQILTNLTVHENLLLGRASRRKGEWTVERVCELFPNLARGLQRPGTSLSGGEQQMLAIGRALMMEPRILLLDEPTEGLAPVIIDQLIAALEIIQQTGTALLLVEQHIQIVERLATRFVALVKGRVSLEGNVSELGDRAVQEVIAL